MSDDHEAPARVAPDPVDHRIDDLAQRIDTIAGAVAAVAASQSELLELNRHLHQSIRETGEAQRQDLAAILAALAEVTGVVERSTTRTEHELSAMRATVADGAAPLGTGATTRPAEPTRPRIADPEAEAEGMGIDRLAESIARVEASVVQLVDQPRPVTPLRSRHSDVGAGSDEVRDEGASVRSLSDEVADIRSLVEQLDLDRALRDTTDELRRHTDVALAGTIRVLDERFQSLRNGLVPTTPATGAGGMGFEAGAVMGAVQAAWSRLEQRLEHDFDQLGHQIADVARRIDSVEEALEAVANRPVVSGEQIRKTASSVKGAVVAAREQRRLRRGPT